MSATYDPTLSTSKDWVRFYVGDRGTASSTSAVTNTIFSDEEILAVIAAEPNKELAAARMGDTLLAQNLGLVSKAVEDLHISFDHSPSGAYARHIASIREKGCRLLLEQSGAHSLRNF